MRPEAPLAIDDAICAGFVCRDANRLLQANIRDASSKCADAIQVAGGDHIIACGSRDERLQRLSRITVVHEFGAQVLGQVVARLMIDAQNDERKSDYDFGRFADLLIVGNLRLRCYYLS
jgi:hypothetical protein